MSDALVYDFSQTSRVDPSVFVSKQYLSINDDMNQNYSGGQCVISTSSLSNSNKYLDYRSAYLQIPLLLTLTSDTGADGKMAPATAATSCDYAISLKSWIGSVIHNMTIDLNGTTVAQMTNFLPMYNNFKLLTTLSFNDYQMFSSIGFAKDDALSVTFQTGNSESGIGVCNNENALTFPTVTGVFNRYGKGNEGLVRRQMYFNYNPAAVMGTAANAAAHSTLLSTTHANQLYKSYIFNKINATTSGTVKGVYQQAIIGTVYLKHLHDFFDKMPLSKGIFMKLTLGISNSSVAFTVSSNVISNTVVTNPLGGVQCLQIASALAGNGSRTLPDDNYIASLSVGGKCLNSTQQNIAGVTQSPLSQSISLNVPSYVFQPQMEIAYLSSPVKRIIYKDLYQFNIQNVASGSQINSLISSSIANMKRVICMPFFTAAGNGGSLHQIQSPFDGAGTGTLAPYTQLGNFQVVVSGANTFSSTIKYNYEMWNNHVYGTNSINSGQIDGISSSLIDSLDWETCYGYYVADVSRMLSVEDSVPKSLAIQAQNLSGKEIDVFVFVEYQVDDLQIDLLTGSRV